MVPVFCIAQALVSFGLLYQGECRICFEGHAFFSKFDACLFKDNWKSIRGKTTQKLGMVVTPHAFRKKRNLLAFLVWCCRSSNQSVKQSGPCMSSKPSHPQRSAHVITIEPQSAWRPPCVSKQQSVPNPINLQDGPSFYSWTWLLFVFFCRAVGICRLVDTRIQMKSWRTKEKKASIFSNMILCVSLVC